MTSQTHERRIALLRFGSVGAGFVAKFHCSAYQQVRDMELAGVTALAGAEVLSQHAQNLGIGPATVFPSVTELAKNVDVVCLFMPNFARVEVMEEVVAACKAGADLRGIICEKPLGRNVKEARRMIELAQEVGLSTAYFENQIFMRAIQTARLQLAPVQQSMGPLMRVVSAEEHGGPHEPWFWDPTKQGGGVLCDMGCHSIAVSEHVLTPDGKPVGFLEPVSVMADISLHKWGQPHWRQSLLERHGIDYRKTQAEDHVLGVITFRNPETEQKVKAQFTDSWMFDKQGLRLFMEGYGPGYAFEINSLTSPLTIFIGDVAAKATADAERALEKSTASRGLLAVQPNEADLYGYTSENDDAVRAFTKGEDGMLPWSYGLRITQLVCAAYMSAERGRVIDLTDPAIE